jgi:hypothetical protein
MPKPITVPLASTGMTGRSEPAWIRDMQSHFARTGGFQPSDVHRILGDQREAVALCSPASGAVNLAKPNLPQVVVMRPKS